MAVVAPTGDAGSILGLLRSVAAMASSGAGLDEAMSWALDLVCDYTGWPLGHVYRLAADGESLVPSDIWHDDDPVAHRPFVAATMAMPLALGAGMPGRIQEAGESAWIPSLASDPDFPRADAAARAGLRAGFGFPIVTTRGVEGVMEFFAAEVTERDEQLLDLVAHIGVQVGHVVDRGRSRELLEASETRLRNLVELAPDALIVVAADGTMSLVNQETERLTNFHRDELVGKPVEVLIPERLRTRHMAHRGGFAAKPARRAMGAGRELVVRRRDGREVPVDVSLSPIDLDQGPVVVVALRDVTERRQAEERRRAAQAELAVQQETLERIARGEPLENTLTSLCLRIEAKFPGTRCSVLLADPGTATLHHAAGPSLPPSFCAAIDGLPIADGAGACGTAAARRELVVVADTLTDPLTSDFVDPAVEHRLRSVWSQPLTHRDGEILGTFAVYRSAPHQPSHTELRAVGAAGSLAALAIERDLAERALTAAANVDSLTGLPNRARFLQVVRERLAGPDARIAVMFIDLDRFNLVNDSLGHPAGDRILVEVTSRLEDAVAGRAIVARFGGDEFTIMVPSATADDVEELAVRIRRTLAEPFGLDGGEFFLTASVGIALNDHPGDAYKLIRDADAAMYAAKESGSGRHAIFDEALRDRLLDRVTLERQLRRAIDGDEFVMHYQPVADPVAGRWVAVEALVRWERPGEGTILPDRFIPLAEETGLIVPLGLKILELVARDAAEMGDISVAVNVSVVQLTDPTFVESVMEILDRHPMVPSRLALEVTESALMEHLERVQSALAELTALGIRVVIDDFGTGYSSIGRLGDLPISAIKIDRRFTANLVTDPRATAVLAAVTDLAHALDLRVVAEGIETPEALMIVRDVGCEFAQGHHLARPVPRARLGQVLATPPAGVSS